MSEDLISSTNNTPAAIPDGPGVVSPQQYTLQSALLILGDGQAFELKPSLIEISIFEDIFSPTLSGYIMVTDSSGFIEYLNYSGFCFLDLNLSKTEDNQIKVFEKVFRVYKIGQRTQTSRQNEQYALHFCSEELILSEQIKIAKSYRNSTISDMVNRILTDELKVDSSKIYKIENSKGLQDKIVPNIKPFEAINWLATYAQPESSATPSADMIFYQNNNGFNFRSLQSIFNDTVYANYNYSPQNLVETETNIDYNTKAILSYKFKNTFDALKIINSGGYSNKIVTIDPLLRTSKSVTFDYDDYAANAKKLNDYSINNGYVNRLGIKTNQMYNSVFKIATGNADQRYNDSISQATNGTFSTITYDIGIETYVPYRTAQLSLVNHTKIEFMVPGDPELTVGSVVRLLLPSLIPADIKPEANLDEYYSAKYLVTAVRHKVDILGFYQCIVEAVTDSVQKEYAQYDGTAIDTVKTL